ncbi:hypothetical protein [Arsenophonus sp. PmNCSU2021_1]|uniref:hypothetical protein n=1 Tax=Arsenophonus sp. PmNCSU2021_1 TaxID=3118989 RepID=UPI002FF05CA8
MQKISVDLQGNKLKLRIELFNVKLKAKTENANQLFNEIDQLNHEHQQQLALLSSMKIKLESLQLSKNELEKELSTKKNDKNNKQIDY